MVICPNCGEDVREAKFCQNCGEPLPETAEEIPANVVKDSMFCKNRLLRILSLLFWCIQIDLLLFD